MATLLPDFEFAITGYEGEPFRLTRRDSQMQITSATLLSSGEAQIFALGLDLLTIAAMWNIDNESPRLLLLDEPDLHLHPDLQQHLARFLVELVHRYRLQLLVASHSTTLLASLGQFGGSLTSVIFLNNSVEEQDAFLFDTYLKELSACLGGHALMGPLFAMPLLLVEGDDDYRVWSNAARSGQLRLAVLPTGGDEIENSGRALERLLSVLRADPKQPSGYLLRDGDDKGQPSDERKHVLRLRLSCHELENLYLTDEMLAALGTDWERAREEIKRHAPQFGEKAERLTDLADSNRAEADLKNLMEELTRILDPKSVDWRVRLGRLLGSSRPKGQLAQFLGARVVNALWP